MKTEKPTPKFKIGDTVIYRCRHTGRQTEGVVSSMNYDRIDKVWRYATPTTPEAPEWYFRAK